MSEPWDGVCYYEIVRQLVRLGMYACSEATPGGPWHKLGPHPLACPKLPHHGRAQPCGSPLRTALLPSDPQYRSKLR